jgi:hypothetical protein
MFKTQKVCSNGKKFDVLKLYIEKQSMREKYLRERVPFCMD